MTSQNKQWQDVKENYLKLIEQNLAQVDHPRRAEILENVLEHLDNKYAELYPEQQNWESFQQIITEMGPPEEYAELLSEDNTSKPKATSGINTFLAILFVIVLAAVGGYLIYTAKDTNQAGSEPTIYVNDLPVNGIAIGKANCTADFVQSLLGSPKRIDSDGRMLRYTDHGFDLWFSGNGPLSEIHLNRGFKGTLDTGISMASTKQDVFRAYGKPTQTVLTDNLHRKNDNRFLYQKGNISRIYYGNYGLIFWFEDNTINQIVPFKGHMEKPDLSAKSVTQPFEFEMDEQVLGKWVTVDFVQHIDDFDPAKKKWPGDLFLLSLDFQINRKVLWKAENRKPWMLDWTKGKVSQNKDRPAFYYLRNIDGQTYLFYEWVSGDVTDRGREPAYYVLKQVKNGEAVIPSWFENDPQAIGYWTSVDFVETIEDFRPEERKQTEDLFLKTLHFEDNGKLSWKIGDSNPIGLNWTKGTIRPSGIWPAMYSIKQINKTDYLFYEYRTRDRNPAGYYVFKRAQTKEATRKTPQLPFVNDPQVLGQWNTVDFIRTPDAFDPHLQSWQGELWVKKLNFKEQGIVKWCLGEDQMKANHRWTKGKLLDDELPSRYFIETYEDGDYLFMEWNSGDVTIRGQKPCYYVLKKEE